jgi:hypothetical protein
MIELIDTKCGDKVYSLEDWSQRPIEWTIKGKTSSYLFISDGHSFRTLQWYEFEQYFPTAAEAVSDSIATLDRRIEELKQWKQRIAESNADLLAGGAIVEVCGE